MITLVKNIPAAGLSSHETAITPPPRYCRPYCIQYMHNCSMVTHETMDRFEGMRKSGEKAGERILGKIQLPSRGEVES